MIGQIVFRQARKHRGANINAEKGDMIPLWDHVEVKRVHIIKQDVEEWAELGGVHEGWFIASEYPDDLYRSTGGRMGRVITRVDIPPKDVWIAETLSEYEAHHMSRPEWNQWDPIRERFKIPWDNIVGGLPGIIPLTPPPREPLYVRLDQVKYKIEVDGKMRTEDLNDFHRRAFSIMAPRLTPKEIENAWTSATQPGRAFTNFDRNRYQICTFVRQHLQLVSPIPFEKYGDEFYAVRTIATRQAFDAAAILNDLRINRENSRYFNGAMNSTKVRLPDGSTVDENFHQLGGGYVPVALLSESGVSWLRARWVKRIYKEG